MIEREVDLDRWKLVFKPLVPMVAARLVWNGKVLAARSMWEPGGKVEIDLHELVTDANGERVDPSAALAAWHFNPDVVDGRWEFIVRR